MDVNVKSVPRREEKSAIVGCLFLGGGWGRVDWGKPPKQMVHRPGSGPAGVLVVLGFQGSFHDTQQWVPSPCIDCCTTSTVSVLRSYSDNPPATPPVSSAFVLHCEKKTLRVCCVSWLCLWMRGVLCPGGDNIMLRRIHIIAYWFSFCQQSYKFHPPPPSWIPSGCGHRGLWPCKVSLRRGVQDARSNYMYICFAFALFTTLQFLTWNSYAFFLSFWFLWMQTYRSCRCLNLAERCVQYVWAKCCILTA